MNQTTPFVGREKEIALFKQCFEAVLPENQGKPEYANLPKVLSFYGAAGVGKTALKEKFLEIAQEMCPDVVLCHFYDLGTQKSKDERGIYEEYPLEKMEVYKNNKYIGSYTDKAEDINVTPDNHMDLEVYKLYENEKVILFVYDGSSFARMDLWIYRKNFPNIMILYFNEQPVFEGANFEDVRSNFEYLSEKAYFNIGTFLLKDDFKELYLRPLNFRESKELLNGFFSQFDDQYLHKIYEYTKGYPLQLSFLVNLVKEEKVSAEGILNELVKNEGKLIANLEEALLKSEALQEEKAELEHKVLSTATHNLNQKFGSMLAQFSTIKTLIEQLEKGETLPIPLETELETFYQTLQDATQTFNTTARVLDKQKLKPIVTNITQFFESEIVPLANGKDYTIELITKTNSSVLIDREAFKDAMRNLINNAEKHGFLEEGKDYRIIFSLSETYEKQVKITYQNNGRPFPKGFTFQDFKLLTGKADKKSKAKGAGIGGFWINKVIDLHKGSWAMIEKQPEDKFPIQFEIFLNKYEHSVD